MYEKEYTKPRTKSLSQLAVFCLHFEKKYFHSVLLSHLSFSSKTHVRRCCYTKPVKSSTFMTSPLRVIDLSLLESGIWLLCLLQDIGLLQCIRKETTATADRLHSR